MVRSLEKLCLGIVCTKLKFYYEICEKNRLKIPYEIGNKIIKYLNEYKTKIDDDDAQIFNKNIMEFTHFTCNGKYSFSEVNYFDFLNNHQLDSCSLTYIKDFKVKSHNFKLTVKNLNIESVSFFLDLSEEKKNFFEIELKLKK